MLAVWIMPVKAWSASSKWRGESSRLHKEREKKSRAGVAKIYGRNESSLCEIVKKEEEILASFAISSQLAKFTAIVHGQSLVWKTH